MNTLLLEVTCTEQGAYYLTENKLAPDFTMVINILSKKAVRDVQGTGKICILDVDLQGVRSLKKTDLNPRYVFVKPPSMEVLVSLKRINGLYYCIKFSVFFFSGS